MVWLWLKVNKEHGGLGQVGGIGALCCKLNIVSAIHFITVANSKMYWQGV